ncbi:MAG: DUF998 domain-containing protein [Promethearchaeota archaeon]
MILLEVIYELIEKCNGKFDIFYKKFNGGFFAFLGVSISIISIVVAYFLYVSVDPTFSVFSNWISDLGGGPNGAGLVFNSGMIITSFIMLFFQIYLNRNLQVIYRKTKILKLAIISGYISLIGLFFVGIFPLNQFQVLHGIAADLFFFGGLFSSIFLGISEIKTPNIPRFKAILGFITAFSFGLYIIVAVGALFIPLITGIVKFLEWVTVVVLLSWMFENGLYVIMLSYTIIISTRGISLKKL